MKQSLQLKLGQHLTMTPQLQQAIRLLQLSGIELQQEIQQALESNPMLEMREEEGGEESSEEYGQAPEGDQAAKGDSQDMDMNLQETIPDELAVDSNWEDMYESYIPTSTGSDQQVRDFEIQGQTTENLHDHLMWQVQMSPFSKTDMAIAMAIVDAIDDDGYLSMSVEDIHLGLGDDLDVELDEVNAVLHRIQTFDPPGIGAQNLQESMLIQLKQYDPETPWLSEAHRLVMDHFDLLANRDYTQLMRRLKLSEEDLAQVIGLIQSLNPRPGSQISDTQPEYIIPDVFVRKVKGKWIVELNPDITPKLSINSLYAGMIKRANNSSDNTYLKNQLQEARWFMKSLLSRSETLLKVATCIVERQQDFLEHGEEAMKPLVMYDIAEAVNMHESTISRVTTKKYMHTPKGIYELKYFFSSHVSTAGGGECSSTAIRAMIKKLIASESPTKPLSDSKLATTLADKGIKVARRTVAKYREAMSIPPSNERKRLA
jgi:RNA polymerase sigma-54 factor